MSALADDIRENLMNILKVEEDGTDLDNLAVLSRVGLKVASSTSVALDADTTSASSTALIDLGVRLSEATAHGALKEIILHNNSGYSILMAINDEYIIFGALTAVYRIGYYLGYLRELTKKLAILISGGEVSESALSLQETELRKIEEKREEEAAKATKIALPTSKQDKEALDDLLGYLDDWDKEEKESMGIEESEDLETNNVVSIPESMMVTIPKESETIPLPGSTQVSKKIEIISGFKVYQDEVPPIPLEDYSPIEVDDTTVQEPEPVSTPTPTKVEEPPSPEELPSFDELAPPNFESEFSASEYDTKFVLEEESEALDSVLKDLGWEEKED